MNPPVEDIAKYLDGSLTEIELETLNDWRTETPENETYFQELSYIWQSSNQNHQNEKDALTIDTEVALQNVNRKIDSTPVVQLKPRRHILAIACGLAALIIAGIGFSKFLHSGPDTILFASLEQREKVELPDGSIAWLEPNSQLSYSTSFLDDRSTKTEGEVFFDVQRNPSKPFTIQSPNLHVTVLGTSFVVQDKQSESNAYVTVISGKVQVENKSKSKSIILTKQQTGTYTSSTTALQIQKTPKNINHLHTITQYVAFYNNNLSDVTSELENISGTKITLQNSSLNTCLFTGQFKTNNVETILNNMQPIYNFSVYKKDNEFIISKGYCKK